LRRESGVRHNQLTVVEHVVTDESVEEIDELLVETFRFCLELMRLSARP